MLGSPPPMGNTWIHPEMWSDNKNLQERFCIQVWRIVESSLISRSSLIVIWSKDNIPAPPPTLYLPHFPHLVSILPSDPIPTLSPVPCLPCQPTHTCPVPNLKLTPLPHTQPVPLPCTCPVPQTRTIPVAPDCWAQGMLHRCRYASCCQAGGLSCSYRNFFVSWQEYLEWGAKDACDANSKTIDKTQWMFIRSLIQFVICRMPHAFLFTMHNCFQQTSEWLLDLLFQLTLRQPTEWNSLHMFLIKRPFYNWKTWNSALFLSRGNFKSRK